jgi:aspartyl/asparaginyl beta-hydroxylase (cupin superfamily)
MTTTSRQNNLILNQDWKRIYQTFKNADFKSYDFENLRRVIITYLRENYPEDFNDYIESSEYLALIDAVAFLGQSLAFRTDLASREQHD